MHYSKIFADLDDFRTYADGLQADTTYRQLFPSILSTALEMEKVITQPVFTALAVGSWTPAASEDCPEPQSIDLSDGLELLKFALASGTLYRYQIFATIKRAGSEAALYKYQHEELKRTYIENYWKAMDNLLDWMDEHSEVAGWGQSPDYALRQSLPVRSAEEFNDYFGINRSSYFYAKALYLVRDCWNSLSAVVLGHEENEDVMQYAKKALCYSVIAKVVLTWDEAEFPRSIRFDDSSEYSKAGQTAQREKLHAALISEVKKAMADIEHAKHRSSDEDACGNSNEETDKFYMCI